MKKSMLRFLTGILAAFLICSCSKSGEKKFDLIASSQSGITFRNTLKESVDFNIFNYMYFYNGGGVAVGDVNDDGLPDIYFTSNQEANKLYINQGALKFKDVTEDAGVEGFKGWTTGVTMADVNDDGKIDIYVCYLGDYLIYKGKNQLFINEGNGPDGNPRFTDRAMEYGLDLVGFSTQASFFDYDRDGDLDMFMLNHSLHQNGTFGKSNQRNSTHALAGDRLLRNDNGRFVDVTQGSGIYSSALGYGLGIVVSDINMDGWPDIYVGNDFHENDYLYINQHNGTFSEVLEKEMNHTSRYTMGVDFADFNNDAFPDLIAMDMLPANPRILKASAAEDPYDVYNFKINYGFNHQFARNTLQLNNHNGTFSEVALLSGVAATDWSWATLFADFDLDGHKDIFVANGILRRSNDLDYINFISVDSIQMKMKYEMSEQQLSYISKMPQIKLANALFLNNRDTTFTDKAREWGLDKPSYSNGAAYADLDNDGDLDLVINNVEDEAFLYENKTISADNNEEKNSSSHYLRISLKGKSGNRFGIGTKVFLYQARGLQMQECMPTRGYQSSVDYRLVFGTGRNTIVDSLLVIWNDGSVQKLSSVNTDQQINLDQNNASGKFNYTFFHPSKTLFVAADSIFDIDYRHKENKFVEFNREALIPHMMSAEGPGSAVGDLNNDGMDDLFLGGAKWNSGHTYIQTAAGKFKEIVQPVLKQDSTYEDVDATFFDADNDKDNDLLVVSGGNEYSGQSNYRRPRLYLNDGKGNLSASSGLPEIFSTGSCAAISDIDNDGDNDIFIGTRAVPWNYGVKPDSYILINDGKGNFLDATDNIAPVLRKFGFVKNARWSDINGDKVKDLVVATEWNPITVLYNLKGKLQASQIADNGLQNTNGWWNVIEPVDIDNDGDMDLVAGNLGLNSKLHASIKEPIKLFVSDFDKNDSTDQLLTHFINGKEYIFHTRDEMTKQMPYLKKKYLSYHKFSEATFRDMYTEEQLKDAERYAAYNFESGIIENLGAGKFRFKPLPKAAQFSTINTILSGDFDNDGNTDLLVAGNFYPINIQMGRNDASYGLFLRGNGKGHFTPVPPFDSGFSLEGETRSLKKINIRGKDYYIAARNNNTVKLLTTKK
jgi:hypothetical protein